MIHRKTLSRKENQSQLGITKPSEISTKYLAFFLNIVHNGVQHIDEDGIV